MAPNSRPSTVTGYVALANACLGAPPDPAGFDAPAEAAFAAKINRARAEEGLPPLQVRPALLPAARFHSLDQIWNGTFGHSGADGRTQGDRISALDRTLVRSFAAENVAWVSGDLDPAIVPDLLHNGLMESPGHRKNILADQASHMAIGVARVYDGWAVTQLFVRQEGEMTAPVPACRTKADAQTIDARLANWSPAKIDEVPDEPRAGVRGDPACPAAMRAALRIEGRRPMPGGGYQVIMLAGPSVDTGRAAMAVPGPADAP
ncbi:MAG: CAP domain-containing protein [Pseudomonadota bacterium]